MPYANFTTIILGADGFLGRNLVEYWTARNWPVHAVGRDAGDFTDPSVVDAAFRAAPGDTARILHAITKQRTGAIQYGIQGELLRDNARIHLNVLEAWRNILPGAKLVSLGSSCVYPESTEPLPEAAFASGVPHPSVLGYALAKEILGVGCQCYGMQYGLRWLHCVLATVYGPFAHTAEHRSHFMAALISRAIAAKAMGEGPLQVWGNPETVRDLLHVTDQIEAIIAADAAFSDCVLNVTSNAPVTVRQCAEDILVALNWPAGLLTQEGSFQGTPYKSLDSSRFLQATGWSPKIGVVEGVRRSIAAYLKGDVLC